MIKRVLSQSIPATFRWYMAITFLIYGLAKLVAGQFGEPTPDISAMRGEGFTLAWTFFGYSKLYEIFIGIGEVAAAILLLIPRTYTLGAVVYFPISFNVMMINYCYNIGVQDLSTVLVIMNLVLLWMDRKALFSAFFRKEASL